MYLSDKHVTARLNWCILKQQWTMQQWDRVAFTDEYSFTLRPINNHLRALRKAGTRYENDSVAPTFKSGNVSLCIWGMFSSYGCNLLVRINGTLDEYKYIGILKQCLIPFKNRYQAGNTGFVYQHDGW